jgi:hypothetical protein
VVNSNYNKDTSYKIGASLTAMVALRDLNIGVPDQVTFKPAGLSYVRADYSRVSDGAAMASWVWDIISIHKLALLLNFLNGTTFASVYIQTDVRDGTFAIPKNAFKVFSAIMWKPLLYGEDGVPVARSPYAMQTVNIQFVNLVEQIGYLSL